MIDTTNTTPSQNSFDGFYFTAASNEFVEGQPLILEFFVFNDELKDVPIDHNGYSLAFFKITPNGIVLNDVFDAILLDPMVYIKNLIGSNLFGCVVRKTDKTGAWIQTYLDSVHKKIDEIKKQITKEYGK